MKLKLGLVLCAAAFGLSAVAATSAPAQAATGGVSLPATCTNATTGLPAPCTLALTGFQVIDNTLNAVLQLTNTATGAVTTITTPVAASGTCQVLSLTLGPLHLDLLGLVVDLNQVNLNITAQSGSGQLLGNLLCSVAHLLDQNQLGALSTLLNRLLGGGLLGVV